MKRINLSRAVRRGKPTELDRWFDGVIRGGNVSDKPLGDGIDPLVKAEAERDSLKARLEEQERTNEHLRRMKESDHTYISKLIGEKQEQERIAAGLAAAVTKALADLKDARAQRPARPWRIFPAVIADLTEALRAWEARADG